MLLQKVVCPLCFCAKTRYLVSKLPDIGANTGTSVSSPPFSGPMKNSTVSLGETAKSKRPAANSFARDGSLSLKYEMVELVFISKTNSATEKMKNEATTKRIRRANRSRFVPSFLCLLFIGFLNANNFFFFSPQGNNLLKNSG